MPIDNFGCIKNTIKVYAGHYFDLRNPDPKTVDIFSIANALSKVCRFGGHTPEYYSVAEHLIHAANLAQSNGESIDVVRAVFLHDAAEAYTGDIVKPLKVMLPEFTAIEDQIEIAVAKRFDVDFIKHHQTIKRYDRLMLKAEKMRIWPTDSEQWFGFGGIEEVSVDFKFYGPDSAQVQFLCLAHKLGIE